jgi:hypothetical protein
MLGVRIGGYMKEGKGKRFKEGKNNWNTGNLHINWGKGWKEEEKEKR